MTRSLLRIVTLIFAVAAAPLAAAPPALSQADIARWLDGYMPAALKAGDVAGATVVIVRDGRLLTARGYGLADIAERRPVDALQTAFRLGSVTKIFTWIAVMQQVERGRLDLDRDINTYLDFHVAPRNGPPITLRTLMTHTAGFDEHMKKLFVGAPSQLQSLEHYVKEGLPPRVYGAGEVPSYSNYGAALAAYIVQRASGEPFDAYVDRHILRPVGMTRTSLRQPLPPAIAPMLATGYRQASAAPIGFEWLNNQAAGGMTSTGADMARFMIMALNGGQAGRTTVVRPGTLIEMGRRQNLPSRPFQTMGLGLLSTDRNGIHVIGHDGDLQSFKTVVYLLPAKNIGIFVAMNSAGQNHAGHRIRTMVFQRFVDRYFPAPRLDPRAIGTGMAHGREIAGLYSNSRASRRGILALRTLRNQDLATLKPDGTIEIDGFEDLAGRPEIWTETAQWRWTSNQGNQLIAVRAGDRVVGLATDEDITTMLIRPQWWQSRAVALPGLYAGLSVIALCMLLWPIEALLRARGLPAAPRPFLPVLDRLAHGAGITALAAAALATTLLARATDITTFDDRFDPWLYAIQALTLAASIGSILSLVNFLNAWRGATPNLYLRLRSLIQTLGLAVSSFFAIATGIVTIGTSF